jgi:hypothetical protein
MDSDESWTIVLFSLLCGCFGVAVSLLPLEATQPLGKHRITSFDLRSSIHALLSQIALGLEYIELIQIFSSNYVSKPGDGILFTVVLAIECPTYGEVTHLNAV